MTESAKVLCVNISTSGAVQPAEGVAVRRTKLRPVDESLITTTSSALGREASAAGEWSACLQGESNLHTLTPASPAQLSHNWRWPRCCAANLCPRWLFSVVCPAAPTPLTAHNNSHDGKSSASAQAENFSFSVETLKLSVETFPGGLLSGLSYWAE